jgi:hypothetical protein
LHAATTPLAQPAAKFRYTRNFSREKPVELITIATFDNMPAAYIAKGRLEAEGVPCWLKDENLGQTDWLYNIAVGWIKVQVEPHLAARARTIIDTDYSDDVNMLAD